jgi:hypothetical protein
METEVEGEIVAVSKPKKGWKKPMAGRPKRYPLMSISMPEELRVKCVAAAVSEGRSLWEWVALAMTARLSKRRVPKTETTLDQFEAIVEAEDRKQDDER